MNAAETLIAARTQVTLRPNRDCAAIAIRDMSASRGDEYAALAVFAQAADLDANTSELAGRQKVWAWWDAATPEQRDAAFSRAIELARTAL